MQTSHVEIYKGFSEMLGQTLEDGTRVKDMKSYPLSVNSSLKLRRRFIIVADV